MRRTHSKREKEGKKTHWISSPQTRNHLVLSELGFKPLMTSGDGTGLPGGWLQLLPFSGGSTSTSNGSRSSVPWRTVNAPPFQADSSGAIWLLRPPRQPLQHHRLLDIVILPQWQRLSNISSLLLPLFQHYCNSSKTSKEEKGIAECKCNV